MPIYEYVCTACGKEFEVMQKFSDKPLRKCTCSSHGRVERKLSAPSFHLQGGGWYAEGYSNKKDGNGKAEPKAEAKSGAEPTGAAKSGGAGAKPAKAQKSAKKDSAPASA